MMDDKGNHTYQRLRITATKEALDALRGYMRMTNPDAKISPWAPDG